MIVPSREVFSLDIASKIWYQLPDLPENMQTKDSSPGFLIKGQKKNGDESMYVAVHNRKRSAYLVTDSESSKGNEMAELDSHSSGSNASFVGFGDGRTAASFCNNHIYNIFCHK